MTGEPEQSRLPVLNVGEIVRAALHEDLGLAGDLTSLAVVPRDATASARIVARSAGCIAGLDLAEEAFHRLDPAIRFSREAADGQCVGAGTALAAVDGAAAAILGAERVALNFLMHMSGIATLTRRYVEAVEGLPARICCTRKTLPGLRAIEKYAVRVGGGMNHRFGLFDAVLIKDNHIAQCGGVANAIRRARASIGHMVKIEVEVDTTRQLTEALGENIDAVLLDNMTPGELGECVTMVNSRALTEASGGVSLATVRAIAESGVDMISVGALTHSASALDISLDFAPCSA